MNRTAARILLIAAALASAASLLTCRRNNPPDTPIALNWPPAVWRDSVVEYRVVVSDIDGDAVAVRFEWADSTVSEWSTLIPSGETIAVAHTWDSVGSYNVRVQARDEHEKVSWWTGQFVQMVILRQPPLAPSTPAGPVKGGVDSVYTFTSIAHDSSPTRVSIRFDWGNGDTSDWSELVAAGETVALTHAWPVADTCFVRAQARDTGVVPSPWSSPCSIIVRPADTLRKWRVQLRPSELHATIIRVCPAIAPDGTVIIGSSDSAVYAVNPDGSVRWRCPLPAEVRAYRSPAIASDGTVYIGSGDHYLNAIGPDGTLRWRTLLDGSIRSTPALGADGTVFAAGKDSLYALDPGGSIRWRSDLEYSTRSSPAIGSDGTVYAVSRNGKMFALRPDGTRLWRNDLDRNTYSSPALGADGTIYLGLRSDTLLVALNPDSTVRWYYHEQSGASAGYSSPVVGADGTIYIGSLSNALYAIKADGSLRWRLSTTGNVYSAPTLAADGTVYCGSYPCFYAVNPDGSVKWVYETDASVQSAAAIGADGTVYFVSTDGWLYALKGTAPLADSPWPKFHHDARNTGRAGARR